MPASDYQELLLRHLDAENRHHFEDTLATLTPDCVFEDRALGERFEGHCGATAYYRMWWEALDTEVTPERLHLVEPAIAVAETTWRGTHSGAFLGVAPTGRSIAVPVILVAELRDGLMSGERIYWDRATVLEQLGQPLPI
jgi:steroid delta-isomerase-like uncharacterized protein